VTVSESKSPETLPDLLRTLERSQDLRPLARECGLSVRELRKRLGRWRRELAAEPTTGPGTPATPGTPGTPDTAGAGPTAATPAAAAADRGAARFPALPRAADLDACPLPETGSAVLEIASDGASRGNPGPAAVGVVFRQKDGPDLCEHAEAIGRATNNQAEYRAVLAALEHCDRWGVGRVHLLVDSELVVRQLNGRYRVKSQDLLPLYQQVMHLARRLREFRVRHVPRARNAHADHLANRALDSAG
jgi:ribonuclease HI